jgi:hypothetical protein
MSPIVDSTASLTDEAVHDCRTMQNFGGNQPYQSGTLVALPRTHEISAQSKTLQLEPPAWRNSGRLLLVMVS